MSKKNGSFISIPTIIFLFLAYSFIFDDDDKKNKVEVKTSKEPAVSQDEKVDLNDLKTQFKEVIIEAKEVFDEVADEVISELDKKESQEAVEEEKPKEEIIVSKEKIEPPELKPLDDAKDEPMFKKL